MFKEEDTFKRGDKVFIRDFPLGKPLNIEAKIVGVLSDDLYSVLLLNGLNEGKIVKFKTWSLYKKNAEL